MKKLAAFIAFSLIGAIFWIGHRPAKIAPDLAFYYWKTRWDPSPELLARARRLGAKKLYLRVFDVRWDASRKSAVPDSPLQFATALPEELELVPVVYITNAVFLHESRQGAAILASRVREKITQVAAGGPVHFRQAQIDCDWSDRSRENYFLFLRRLREQLRPAGVELSTTIRLHQIKYFSLTGVPPVSRGMLMFYNFGPIRADAERSSIFNATDALRYSPYLAKYPLPLDLSLPIFSWLIHSRGGQVLGLIEKLNPRELAANPAFLSGSAGAYAAARSVYFRGRYFRGGDHVNLEASDPHSTEEAAHLAAKGIGTRQQFGTVAFFDLDEANLQNYPDENLSAILRQFL